MKTADPTLSMRALEALYKAYVDPNGEFDVQVPDALAANLCRVHRGSRATPRPAGAAAYAIKLIRTIGPLACIKSRWSGSAAIRTRTDVQAHDADSAPQVRRNPGDQRRRSCAAGCQLPARRARRRGDRRPRQHEARGQSDRGVARRLLAEKGRIPRWVAIEACGAQVDRRCTRDRRGFVVGQAARATGAIRAA